MDVINTIVVALLVNTSGIALFLILYFVLVAPHPEKVDNWAAILNKILSGFGGLFKSAHRNYVKYDLQGKINSFTKEASKTAPYLENMSISIQWQDVETDRKAFLQNGAVVLRLKRQDPDELNFVHGAYWSVSTKLLPKVKRYISPSQKLALDLFVTSQLMQSEKYSVVEYFLEQYLHPHMDNGKNVSSLYDQFHRIDKYGVFYPIFLQELYFLSLKVYGDPKNDQVIKEVSQLVDFLDGIASRPTGEAVDMNFLGEYCKFGIVLVGKGEKMSMEGTDPYVHYIEKQLRPKKVETVYVLGKHDYREFITEVCKDLYLDYEEYRTHSYDGEITRNDGIRKTAVKQFLVVMRSLDAPLYQSSGDHK